MKYIVILITFFLTAETPNPKALTLENQDREQVMEVFDLFFNSIRNRDTLALKMCIEPGIPTNLFLQQFSGNDQKITGISTSTVHGFLKTVATADGIVGKCQNEFDNIDIKIYQNFAIVTANYHCFYQSQVNNKGMYSVQLLKLFDKWKINRVTRYAEKAE